MPTLSEIKHLSYERKEMDIQRSLSEEEQNGLREELQRVEIERDKLEEERKIVTSGFNEQFKAINTQRANVLKSLRNKFVEERANCYVVANYDSDMIEYYDEKGILVDSRKMKPSERQTNILQSIAVG